MGNTCVIITAIFGIILSFLDSIICVIVKDQMLLSFRKLEILLNAFLILVYIFGIYIVCSPDLNKRMIKFAGYFIMAFSIEFIFINGAAISIIIWNQGNPDTIDFYKEVAIIVIAYMLIKMMYSVIYIYFAYYYYQTTEITQNLGTKNKGYYWIRIPKNESNLTF